MYKYRMGFVILHYMHIDVTRQCISSIEDKVGEEEYKIVVVDNNSPNKSGEQLQKEYSQNDKVSIILNKKNDGFARGNNVGYAVLREECEYICILNNDVELLQENFAEAVDQIYKKNQFGILGPKIKMLDGRICGLMPPVGTYEEEKKKYYRKRRRYILAVLRLNRVREHMVGWKYRKKVKKLRHVAYQNPALFAHSNIILHGCCLIYSKDYISQNEYAFDPRTDFFGEEALLFLHVRKQNLETLYWPELTILHKESVSTKTSKTNYKKSVFQLGNTARSQKILLQELKGNA